MVNIIQPITVQQAYDGITHARRWASWNWWWRKVDDDGFPSPEPRTDSRSALPREIRAWWRLRAVKCDETFSLDFFSPRRYMELELRSGGVQGGPPPPSWTRCGPPGLHLLQAFFIFSETCLRGFPGHSENFCFLHMKQHHGNSAENSVSPG